MISPNRSQKNLYVLNSVPSIHLKKTHTAKTIMVSPVEANTLYNTTAMAYTLRPYQIAYFAKNRWADTPANMIQTLIIQALQNAHSFRSVVTPSFRGQADYVLNTQLIELQQDFLQNPSVLRLKLQVQFTNAASGNIIRSKIISVTVPTLQNSPCGGAIAANIAVRQALVQIVNFIQ